MGRTENLNNKAPAQCLSSPSTIPLTSTSWLLDYHPAAQKVSFLCLQCWQCRDPCGLARSKWYPRTDTAAIGRLFHRWEIGIGGRGCSNPKHSNPRPIPTMIAIGAGSLYFRLVGSLLPQYSAGGIETRYQQLH